jgi:hypothetical protein
MLKFQEKYQNCIQINQKLHYEAVKREMCKKMQFAIITHFKNDIKTAMSRSSYLRGKFHEKFVKFDENQACPKVALSGVFGPQI